MCKHEQPLISIGQGEYRRDIYPRDLQKKRRARRIRRKRRKTESKR